MLGRRSRSGSGTGGSERSCAEGDVGECGLRAARGGGGPWRRPFRRRAGPGRSLDAMPLERPRVDVERSGKGAFLVRHPSPLPERPIRTAKSSCRLLTSANPHFYIRPSLSRTARGNCLSSSHPAPRTRFQVPASSLSFEADVDARMLWRTGSPAADGIVALPLGRHRQNAHHRADRIDVSMRSRNRTLVTEPATAQGGSAAPASSRSAPVHFAGRTDSDSTVVPSAHRPGSGWWYGPKPGRQGREGKAGWNEVASIADSHRPCVVAMPAGVRAAPHALPKPFRQVTVWAGTEAVPRVRAAGAELVRRASAACVRRSREPLRGDSRDRRRHSFAGQRAVSFATAGAVI